MSYLSPQERERRFAYIREALSEVPSTFRRMEAKHSLSLIKAQFPETRAGHGLQVTEVPPEALLADDYELALVNAPLAETGTNCQYDACESDEACTCQEEE